VGLSVSLGGVGSFAAAFLVGPVTRRFGVGATLIGARLVSDAIRFALPFAGGPRPVILLLIMGSQLLGDVAFTTAMIGEVSVRQAMVPHRFLGRANASMEFFTGGVGPLGALVGGVLGQLLGMRLTLLISCLGILLASLGLLLSPLRALRELTAPEAEPGRV
jgi:predicted MFS family arabinose efflux permease